MGWTGPLHVEFRLVIGAMTYLVYWRCRCYSKLSDAHTLSSKVSSYTIEDFTAFGEIEASEATDAVRAILDIYPIEVIEDIDAIYPGIDFN